MASSKKEEEDFSTAIPFILCGFVLQALKVFAADPEDSEALWGDKVKGLVCHAVVDWPRDRKGI